MNPVRLRLSPSRDTNHTELLLRLSLPRPLQAWELVDLSAALRSWTGRRTRVALSAEGPSEWLDEWACVIEGAIDAIEVEFVSGRREGARR